MFNRVTCDSMETMAYHIPHRLRKSGMVSFSVWVQRAVNQRRLIDADCIRQSLSKTTLKIGEDNFSEVDSQHYWRLGCSTCSGRYWSIRSTVRISLLAAFTLLGHWIRHSWDGDSTRTLQWKKTFATLPSIMFRNSSKKTASDWWRNRTHIRMRAVTLFEWTQ